MVYLIKKQCRMLKRYTLQRIKAHSSGIAYVIINNIFINGLNRKINYQLEIHSNRFVKNQR